MFEARILGLRRSTFIACRVAVDSLWRPTPNSNSAVNATPFTLKSESSEPVLPAISVVRGNVAGPTAVQHLGVDVSFS